MENAFEVNDEENVVIFPATYTALGFGRGFERKERFTPSKEETGQAESALVRDLERLNPQSCSKFWPIIHENLRSYNRQYFGYLESNGDKALFINCSWAKDENFGTDWRKRPVVVEDGGSFYWNIKFNVGKGELFHLRINGSA